MAFFKSWVGKNSIKKYLAYDVTSFSRYSKDIKRPQWGYNRAGDRLPPGSPGEPLKRPVAFAWQALLEHLTCLLSHLRTV
jgi:hypothetical protein